jgi:hypothetical protein
LMAAAWNGHLMVVRLLLASPRVDAWITTKVRRRRPTTAV